MKWKEFLRDYFTFTRKERIGLLAVILIILGIWIFPKVSRPANPNTVPPDTGWITAAKKLMITVDDSATYRKPDSDNVDDLASDRPLSEHGRESKGQLFNFDPNALTVDGWRKLGIPSKTIATIQNYLQKGGHFYQAEDLKKIYGIRADDYARLEPHIRIATTSLEQLSAETSEFKKEAFPKKPKYTMVDINTADTSAFISLPGIGSKLALRIVNFREKLGGFYSIDQIGETFGLPDSSFQKIKPFLKLETSLVKKFNINSATRDEMKLHPYIKWNVANAIVEYRNQHGNFSSLEDLKKISLITTEVFDRAKFYLTL
jgi:competence ComEA-like helix-hairpin-helix protein